MTILPYVLEVGTQEVVLTPDPCHEFTAATEQVALGYGVTRETVRTHKRDHADELLEGKHWITVGNPNGGADLTLWTKRGIVRLGFFIRSARARLFRDMAEDLVIGAMTANVAAAQAAPLLITAENFGKVTGQKRNAVLNTLRRLGIPPVGVGFKKQKQGTYVYELDAVLDGYREKGWEFDPTALFDTYAGRVVSDLSAVRTAKRRGVLTRTAPRPALSVAPITDRIQAAQELVQLEQRRAQLLAALA